MNSDEKIKMIEEIISNEESPCTIIGPLHYGPQVSEFTEAGRHHMDEMFRKGGLPNTLDDCTIIVKISDSKAHVSVVHEGITVFEFKPVEPRFAVSTFDFTGVSIPLEMGW